MTVFQHLDPRLLTDPRFHCLRPLLGPQLGEPMDAEKLHHLESLLQNRGLTLHHEFPDHEGLRWYAAGQSRGIKQPLVCAALYDKEGPKDYFKRRNWGFRWMFLYVGGDGLIHEYDEELNGFVIGKFESMNDIHNVVKGAASGILLEDETEDPIGDESRVRKQHAE